MLKSTTILVAVSLALTSFSAVPASAKFKFNSYDNCPPGLAKRNNGCIPPGLLKQRKWQENQPLPDSVTYELITDLDLYGLTPPNGNWLYYLVDNEVLRVMDATFVVMDALGWVEY